MLCSIIKKCAFQTKFVEISTLIPHKMEVHTNAQTLCTLKYSCRTPNLTTRRWCSNQESNRHYLPPIMKGISDYSLEYLDPQDTCALLQKIEEFDSSFSVFQFCRDSSKAIRIVSHLLAAEEYDELIDLVDNNTLTILKERVSQLTDEQRHLISIPSITIFPTFVVSGELNTTQHAGANVMKVELMFLNRYFKFPKPRESEFFDNFKWVYCGANYKFERKYKSDEAGPWLITHINHFSMPNKPTLF